MATLHGINSSNTRPTLPIIITVTYMETLDRMSDTTYSMPIRLNIWQQNLNKSAKAHWDLINSPVHKEWDVILLQEPYIDAYGNTKVTSNWRVVYPSSHLANDSVVRSVILINSKLDTNHWHQVNYANNNDTTVIQFKGPYGQVTLFNLYNDGGHSNSLTALNNFVSANRQD